VRVAEGAPWRLTLRRHRDLDGRGPEIWVRRGLLLAPLAVVSLSLAGVLGQPPSTSSASAPKASLEISAPPHLRGGLLAQARFEIHARSQLSNARLLLDSGWLEGITVNTIEPTPQSETSAGGRLALTLGRIAAGDTFVLFLQVQVNPTSVGRRSAGVALYDGPTRLLGISRTLTIYP
jgi:hypothetical protein